MEGRQDMFIVQSFGLEPRIERTFMIEANVTRREKTHPLPLSHKCGRRFLLLLQFQQETTTTEEGAKQITLDEEEGKEFVRLLLPPSD